MAQIFATAITRRNNPKPNFHLFRVVWVSPKTVVRAIQLLRQSHPELNCEIFDPRTFFALFKQRQSLTEGQKQ